MKAIYSILFIIILAAPHMTFAAPASSDDPICEKGTPGIIDLTPICERGYDRYYACPDGTYLDFYPDSPICRYKDGDKKAGSAFLKPNPGPLISKNESSNKSKIDSDDIPITSNDSKDIEEYFIPIIITPFVIIVLFFIFCYPKIKKNNSKKNNKASNYRRSGYPHMYDSKIFIQKPKSSITNMYSKPSNKLSNPIKNDPDIPHINLKNTPKQETRSKKRIIKSPDIKPISTNKIPVDRQKSDIVKQKSLIDKQLTPSNSKTITEEHDSFWKSPIIVVDTNIIYDYAGFSLNDKGGVKTPTKYDELRFEKIHKDLDDKIFKKTLYVPYEVYIECDKKIDSFRIREDRWRIFANISDIIKYVGISTNISNFHINKNYHKILGKPESPKWTDDLNIATQPIYEFYEGIHKSEDPDTIKMKEEWEKRKHKHDPTATLIKKSKNMETDRKILGTITQLKDINPGRKIRLFSRDGDFTIFKPLIDKKFGIEVVDASRLQNDI